MRFLATNDDGIESVFLAELARALLAAGHEVVVVAPRTEQSWVSAAKSRHRGVRSAKVELGLGCPTWSVDGTPADCVNIAISHLLGFRPEAVLSGINIGMNAGVGFILGSGTVAGACEGALHGIPGIALSQNLSVPAYERLKAKGGVPDADLRSMITVTASRAAQMAPALAAGTPARSFIVHNINFPDPCRADSPVRRTVPARTLIPGLFSAQAPERAHQLVYQLGEDLSRGDPGTDRSALDAGFISHSVLDFTKLGSS